MDDCQKFVIVYRSSVQWEVMQLNSTGTCYVLLAECRTQSDAEFVVRRLELAEAEKEARRG